MLVAKGLSNVPKFQDRDEGSPWNVALDAVVHFIRPNLFVEWKPGSTPIRLTTLSLGEPSMGVTKRGYGNLQTLLSNRNI